MQDIFFLKKTYPNFLKLSKLIWSSPDFSENKVFLAYVLIKMDMKRYKKLAIPKIESSEMVKNVRDTLKAYKHAKQDVYERISEELKPLTDKIDKEITEISELNQEVTKQSEATQRALKGFTEEMKALATPDQRETETKGSVDFYKGFFWSYPNLSEVLPTFLKTKFFWHMYW